MNNDRTFFADCPFIHPKNFQILNSIEISYIFINKNSFKIEYSFHFTDFTHWKNIISFHTDNKTIPLDNFNLFNLASSRSYSTHQSILTIENDQEYYNYSLSSSDSKIFHFMYYIPFIPITDTPYTDNSDSQISLNTWPQTFKKNMVLN